MRLSRTTNSGDAVYAEKQLRGRVTQYPDNATEANFD
jgi:hypothetical protein